MNLTAAFRVHKSWFVPTTLVLVITSLADCAVAWFVKRPVFWCTLIASTLPLSMIVFVAFPLQRVQSRKRS